MPEQLFSSYLESEFHEIYDDETASRLAIFLDQYMFRILARGSEGIKSISPENVQADIIIDELQEWWNTKGEHQNPTKPQLLALFDILFLLRVYSKQLPKIDVLGIKGLINATLGGELPQLFSDREMDRVEQNDLRTKIDYEITGQVSARYRLMTATDGLDHKSEIEVYNTSILKLKQNRLEYSLPKPARLRLIEIMGQKKLIITDALTALGQESVYSE